MSRASIERLVADSLMHLGVDAVIHGQSLKLLFKAADSLYETSTSDFIGATGIVEFTDEQELIDPRVGLLINIDSATFKVISEPLFDQTTKLWQMQVMEV